MNTVLVPIRKVLEVARLRPFDTSTEEGRSRERYRRIVLSTAAAVASRVVAALTGLVSVPIAIAYLGKEQYGLWAAIGALAGWVALFDFGIVSGSLNPIAEAHGRDDHAAARHAFSTAFFTLAGIAALLAAALAATAEVVPWSALFSAPAGIPRAVVKASACTAVVFVIANLPFAVVPQMYAAYQRSYVSAAFVALGSVLSLALLVAAVHARASLAWVVAATASALLLAGIANLVYLLARELPWLRPGPSAVSRRALRRILATAVPIYLFQLGGLLVNQTQQLVLARRAGLVTVAEYDLLWRIYLLSMGLVMMGTASFAPAFRDSWERGDRAWLRRSFWRLVRIRMALAVAGGAVLVAAGNDVLRLWLGRSDFRYGLGTWSGLAALVLVAVWASSFAELLTVLDRIWPQVVLVLAQGVLTVAFTWIAAPHGTGGALAGIVLPALLLPAWYLPRLAWPLLRAPRNAAAGGSP